MEEEMTPQGTEIGSFHGALSKCPGSCIKFQLSYEAPTPLYRSLPHRIHSTCLSISCILHPTFLFCQSFLHGGVRFQSRGVI